MKKYIFALLFLTMVPALSASPLHSKLKHSIIIDTDCNDSDLRAISLLLTHPGITIKAIMISDSKFPYESGKKRVESLLRSFNADSINIKKGTEHSTGFSLTEILLASEEEMTLLCLGPLTNVSEQIKNSPLVFQKIEEIIWYCESANPLQGFNFESDKQAADQLFRTGIDIDIISGLNENTVIFDPDFFKAGKSAGTTLAKVLFSNLKQASKNEKSGQSEELAALYLTNPELFEMNRSSQNENLNLVKKISIPAIREVLSDMITGRYKSGHFIALYGFPVARELYVYDIRLIMDAAISEYGIEEWKACVMTDEFHGHLGVFSIVGAKMGTLAREHFGIGTDLMKIKTYAGSVTPFSCMNDGLQVSTGATLGQGTISLAEDTIPKPQAIFTYQDKSIMIKLKPEYLKELKAVIDEGVKNYGLEDEGYWTLVRQTTIRFWQEWDRRKIFELTEI